MPSRVQEALPSRRPGVWVVSGAVPWSYVEQNLTLALGPNVAFGELPTTPRVLYRSWPGHWDGLVCRPDRVGRAVGRCCSTSTHCGCAAVRVAAPRLRVPFGGGPNIVGGAGERASTGPSLSPTPTTPEWAWALVDSSVRDRLNEVPPGRSCEDQFRLDSLAVAQLRTRRGRAPRHSGRRRWTAARLPRSAGRVERMHMSQQPPYISCAATRRPVGKDVSGRAAPPVTP